MSPLSPDKHRFTVHFDVNYHVFQILTGIARHNNQSPHDVARNILLAWMLEIEKKTDAREPVEPIASE